MCFKCKHFNWLEKKCMVDGVRNTRDCKLYENGKGIGAPKLSEFKHPEFKR